MEETRIHLEQILEKLKQRIAALNESIAQGEREVEGMHEYYWENYTEMDQYGYENFDNQQALLNQVNANQALLLQKSRLKKMLDSPYFGRVDFVFDGEEEAESFYIGIGSFSEKKGGVPLIYDWRAPVSSLFYDYDRGEASYEAPGGIMEGEITSKWQYKIRNGHIVYAFESDVKIDDEVLRRELGGSGDIKLKNIIRTIQKEQNAIIRNTRDKIMVIQGVAGSGKTSVALHRIAYLLYHDREHLKSSNILILSPNSVFSDYISHILPELGEENIREMSFDLFAYRELKDVVSDCEDRYDEIERKLMQERMTADAGRRPADSRRKQEQEKQKRLPARDADGTDRKQSPEFISELREYVLFAEDELMQFHDFKYKKFQKTAKEIMDLFYYKFPDVPLLSRMQAVMDYFVDEYETLVNRDFDEEELETIRERFYRMYRSTDLYVIYSDFLKKYGYTPLPHVPREKRVLAYEDVYPMLYMKYLLKTHTSHRQIRHLVIDEMQDYSCLQYLILDQLFQCRMTILGDRAQTMDSEQLDVMKFLPKIFGRQIRCIQMNKSYRNTMEIAVYANRLNGTQEMELFERHGEAVTERTFAEMEEALQEVLRQYDGNEPGKYETSAVLLMNEADAEQVYLWLKKHRAGDPEGRLHYIDKNSSHFKKGLTVTTFYLAKGLEFDQVFTIAHEETREMPLHRQAEYICATRAMHELHMYHVLDSSNMENR
ncbi:MAG: AAA family ATPase [Lachnospiraceae bacterium]|nr:AAA family ATPase [Lachnospiraceae bacterium]